MKNGQYYKYMIQRSTIYTVTWRSCKSMLESIFILLLLEIDKKWIQK